MITIEDLDRMLALMHAHGVDELTLKEQGASIHIRRTQSVSTPAVAAKPETLVRSPAIGEFLLTHPRHSVPQVGLGDNVSVTSIIGFLRSGPLLLPVRSGVSGQVARIDAKPGELLGFGTPIMAIQPF